AIRYFAQKVGVNTRHGMYEATALQLMASRGITEVARLLIELGADVNQHDFSKKTALSKAVDNCHLEMIRLLVEHDADLNQQDEKGRTLLHRFIIHEDFPPYRKDRCK